MMSAQQALTKAQQMSKRLNQQRAGVKRIAAISRHAPIVNAQAIAERIYIEVLKLMTDVTPADLADGEIAYTVTIQAGDPLGKILDYSVETAQRGRK